MATLTDLYRMVRTQTQTTTDELPDTTINPWLKQGFDRTIAARWDWPFYETQWDIEVAAGDWTVALPADAPPSGIMSLRNANGYRLRQVNQEEAETVYQSFVSSTYPSEYSIWGGFITFWPQVVSSEPTAYTLRGFRRPAPWSTLGPADTPDCDERLHDPLAHYATALAYAQQEDEVLEDRYMMRWQRDVELALKAIMEPAFHRPLTMGPHYRRIQPGHPFVINTPGGP